MHGSPYHVYPASSSIYPAQAFQNPSTGVPSVSASPLFNSKMSHHHNQLVCILNLLFFGKSLNKPFILGNVVLVPLDSADPENGSTCQTTFAAATPTTTGNFLHKSNRCGFDRGKD